MTTGPLTSFLALAIGFALAGAVVSLYQAVTARRAGFYLLGESGVNRYAAALMLAFAAPLLILRNVLAMPAAVDPRARIFGVAAATVAASLWSLGSGAALLTILHF